MDPKIPETIFGYLFSNYKIDVIFPPSRESAYIEQFNIRPLELMSRKKSCANHKITITGFQSCQLMQATMHNFGHQDSAHYDTLLNYDRENT